MNGERSMIRNIYSILLEEKTGITDVINADYKQINENDKKPSIAEHPDSLGKHATPYARRQFITRVKHMRLK